MRAVLLAALIAAVAAADPTGQTQNAVLRAVPAPGQVTTDGDLADWDASGAIVIADRQDAPTKLVQVMAMHDAAGLWLALHFRDPSPMINHVDPKTTPGRGWCGDCVQLRIGTGSRHGEATPGPCELLHVDAYWYSDGRRATVHAVHGDFGPGGTTHRTITEAEGDGASSGYRIDADGLGYVQELRLSWKLLRPLDPRPYAIGESLRMAIEPMWGDTRFADQPAARVSDLLDPDLPERAHLWANHRAWGRVDFVGTGKLAPNAETRTWAAWCALVKPVPAETPATPAATPDKPNQPSSGDDATGQLLNRWFTAGEASGNRGEAYDNRCRQHSPLDLPRFPQLAETDYAAADRLAGRDYALFLGVREQVTFGNSSTSGPADGTGCNYRSALFAPAGPDLLHGQYRAGNLYVYPAHHDYHPGHNGRPMWGDLIPVNSPYVLLSRGSSGSDQPFLSAVIRTSAAFTPEVKKALLGSGLLMPTIQAVLRGTYQVPAADYVSGLRHPPVFDGKLLDEPAMVAAAHAMTVENIPPLARVAVVAEEALKPGIDAPAWAVSQRICDTPAAVGRVYRSWKPTMRLTVSAAGSGDLLGRAMAYRWVLLQGDPDKVRIMPRGDGVSADLEIGWHDRFPVQPGSAIHGNRIDIGLFVGNGKAWSAPAFVSVLCPDDELRTWDAKGRLSEIDYAAVDCTIGYDTTTLLPADGIAPYDIRDWPALLREAGAGTGLFGRMCAAAMSPEERAVLARLADQVAAVGSAPLPGPAKGDVHRRWQAERERSERGSRLLLEAQPGLAVPAKRRLEDLLNAWLRDPAWLAPYGMENAAFIKAKTTATATRGGQSDLARFHLDMLTRLVLPGVIIREPKANLADQRLGRPPPVRLSLSYDGDAILPSRIAQTP